MPFRKGRAVVVSTLSVTLLGLGTAVTAAAAAPAQHTDRDHTPAIEQFYPVVREPARGLPTHTVYRPADLRDVGRRVPVVVWANGACRRGNQPVITPLTLIPARGFI